MARSTCHTFLALALLVGACSSTANEADPDGGVPGPDGGAPSSTAPCVVDGYPCAPGNQTTAARDLSEKYRGEMQERRANGESYPAIAEWLGAQDGVVDVVSADDRIRFRVEGGSAHWMYAISSEYPQVVMPPLEAVQAAAASAFAPKSVLRENSSETKIKKKGLILEPFHFQFLSDTPRWQSRLEALHDYDTVEYFKDNTIPDDYFGNWNDYRFVWVLSHGAYLPDANDPEYTAVFSSKACGLSAWISEEIAAGRGLDPIANGVPIASLDGLPVPTVETALKPDQLQRWRTFRDDDLESLKNQGQGCEVLEMPDVVLSVNDSEGNPIVRTPAFLSYIIYDEAWFDNHYSGGLDNVLLYLSICSSVSVPIDVASGKPGAILGWTQPMSAEEDDLATNVLFERLIKHGEMVEDAYDKVQEAGHDQHVFDGSSTNLTVSSSAESKRSRIREIISIIDPVTLEAFPDEGGMLEAREITPEGNTVVDVTVEIVGFGEVEAKEFMVQIFDGNGRAISTEHEVSNPILGETVMTIPVSFNQGVRTPTDFEIEARVTLPEETGTVYSRHPIKLTVGPAIESLWTLNVGGAGTARGDFVFAPFPVGITDGEGRLVWQVTLAQADEFSVPMATLFIVGHNGRTLECTGQTGNFDALVTVMFTNDPMPTEGYGGGLGEGECGDFVNVEIVSFSREDDLVANVSGTICQWKRVGEEVVVTPVPINGRFQMPSAGCGMDPGGDLVGSYHVAEEPSLCIDIYPNAAIAPAFDEVCSMGGGIVCSEEPCSTAGQIGQCDYRAAAVQISFRGQIQHFSAGGDWPSVGDLQAACALQLGTWTTGSPMP